MIKSALINGALVTPLQMDSFDCEFHGNMFFAFEREQTLFHYIPLKYFEVLLQNAALTLMPLASYDADAREGRFPSANGTKLATVSERINSTLNAEPDYTAMIASQEVARCLLHVHCWFGQDTESETMWEDYGDNGSGVCIRSSTSRILKAIAPACDLHVQPGKVTYSDEDIPIADLFDLAPAFRKNPDFCAESEYRLIAQSKVNEDTLPSSRAVPVSLLALIAEVLVGPRCDADRVARVFELSKRFLPGVQVSPSRFWRPGGSLRATERRAAERSQSTYIS